MDINIVPSMDMSTSTTGCCAKFTPEPWDEKEFTFKDKLFVLANTWSFLYIPLNFGRMMKRVSEHVQAAGAEPDAQRLVLSEESSPWRGKHYYAVTKHVPNEKTVTLSGTFVTKVFEGPFQNAGKWATEAKAYAESKGKKVARILFYYTTCPSCAKVYGKNYVVAFVQVVE